MPDTTYEVLFAISTFILGGATMAASLGTWLVLHVYSTYSIRTFGPTPRHRMDVDADTQYIDEALALVS